MSGGARARSGPPPDPNALRRERDGASWLRLPAVGRQTEAPKWPLVTPSRRELALWKREWQRPQAIMWEANGQENEVALYVRTLAEAEEPRATANIRTLVKQQQEFLGLSLPGLQRLRWIIDHGPVVADKSRPPVAGTSKGRLLKVVPDAG